MGDQDAVVNPVATSLQTRMGLGVGVPPRKGIPGRRCCPVATSLVFSPWVRGSAVGLVFRRGSGVPPLGRCSAVGLEFRVKRTVHFDELGLLASGRDVQSRRPLSNSLVGDRSRS